MDREIPEKEASRFGYQAMLFDSNALIMLGDSLQSPNNPFITMYNNIHEKITRF